MRPSRAVAEAMAAAAFVTVTAASLPAQTPGSARAPGSNGSVDCIDLSRVTGPEITQQGTILYRQNAVRSWRAVTGGRCPGLRWDVRLAVFPFQGQRLCRGDRFQILYPQSSVPGAMCRFQGFVPVDRAPAR